MSDFVLINGDKVQFSPSTFPTAVKFIPPLLPGILVASGTAMVNSQKVCLVGDEKKVQVPCFYTAGQYSFPGQGILKIESLEGNQQSTITKNDKALMLEGGNFTAKFEVQVPAQFQAPPKPPETDPMKEYLGQGVFKTTNTFVKAG